MGATPPYPPAGSATAFSVVKTHKKRAENEPGHGGVAPLFPVGGWGPCPLHPFPARPEPRPLSSPVIPRETRIDTLPEAEFAGA